MSLFSCPFYHITENRTTSKSFMISGFKEGRSKAFRTCCQKIKKASDTKNTLLEEHEGTVLCAVTFQHREPSPVLSAGVLVKQPWAFGFSTLLKIVSSGIL